MVQIQLNLVLIETMALAVVYRHWHNQLLIVFGSMTVWNEWEEIQHRCLKFYICKTNIIPPRAFLI